VEISAVAVTVERSGARRPRRRGFAGQLPSELAKLSRLMHKTISLLAVALFVALCSPTFADEWVTLKNCRLLEN